MQVRREPQRGRVLQYLCALSLQLVRVAWNSIPSSGQWSVWLLIILFLWWVSQTDCLSRLVLTCCMLSSWQLCSWLFMILINYYLQLLTFNVWSHLQNESSFGKLYRWKHDDGSCQPFRFLCCSKESCTLLTPVQFSSFVKVFWKQSLCDNWLLTVSRLECKLHVFYDPARVLPQL